jgi:arylsulfatase A-like enzyme
MLKNIQPICKPNNNILSKFKTTDMRFIKFLPLILIILSCENETKQKPSVEPEKPKPNIVFIYMDDLGYGDISAYGATEIQTPNIDKLADGGVKFTKAYASSATCTPSRYAILTGSYPWRNEDAAILPGTAPLIIDTTQTTIPKMLKQEGYQTAVVGKWHLGLGLGNVNWNEEVKPGPNEVGFDYSYIMAATQDRVPTVYLEDGQVVNLDPNDPIKIDYDNEFEGEITGYNHPELVTMKADKQHNNTLVNGVPRIGHMKGGEAARWSDVDMADHFLEKAQSYVRDQKEKAAPFFLYYALQQPHVPRTPHPRFEGQTSLGPRGDVIAEADWVVGEFIKALKEEGQLENTLIVFSSDNGPVLDDGYEDEAVEKLGEHKPSGIYRGGKYSLFEAGSRVPFITYWEGKIKPRVSDALVSQIDLLNSIANLVGSDLRTEDGENLLDVFMGKSAKGRENMVIEAMSRTAYKKGDWVMIPPYDGPKVFESKNIETANDDTYQLYNLKDDPSQQNNLAQSNPDKLEELKEEFDQLRGDPYKNVKPAKFEK